MEILYMHDRGWGTVCNRGSFTTPAARVVCAQLGFSGGELRDDAYFGKRFVGPIALRKFICYGDEKELSECAHADRRKRGTCRHSMDVGVVCGKK